MSNGITQQTPRSRPTRTNPTQFDDFATGYTAAWNAHEAAVPHYADDGSLTINGGETADGRAVVAAVVQSFCDAFPDAVLAMDAVRGVGDRAVFLWTYEGTNTGPGGAGKHLGFSGWKAWTFSPDGLIAQALGNFDATEYERQLAEGV